MCDAGFHGQRDQALDLTIMDADLAQATRGFKKVIKRGPKAAMGMAQDLDHGLVADDTCMAGVKTVECEGEGTHAAMRCAAGQPSWVVNRQGHLTIPQADQILTPGFA